MRKATKMRKPKNIRHSNFLVPSTMRHCRMEKTFIKEKHFQGLQKTNNNMKCALGTLGNWKRNTSKNNTVKKSITAYEMEKILMSEVFKNNVNISKEEWL